jgi:hypothetical protein
MGGAPAPGFTLPPEVYGPIDDAVPDALIDSGLTKRRFVGTAKPAPHNGSYGKWVAGRLVKDGDFDYIGVS